MATLEQAPTSNFWSTSLNGAINDSVTTITLNSTTGLQAPGRLVINRQDSTGTNTPSAREVIAFTGISGSDLTGVTRGADNSTARSHADGSLVESAIVVGNWDTLYDVINEEHDLDGTHDTTKVVDLTTAQTLTNKTLTSPVLQGTVDGWISANETWTYASETTITVPSGAAAKYAKGDKIKLTQTTVKYFYVIGVADTVLTVVGNGAVVVTSATISANYYSHAISLPGFPQSFSYTGLWTSTGTAPSLENGSIISSFSILGQNVFFRFRLSMGSSTTYGTGSYYFSLPVLPSLGADEIMDGSCYVLDSGTGYWSFSAPQYKPTNKIQITGNVGSTAIIGPTYPVTFAAGDIIEICANYRLPNS